MRRRCDGVKLVLAEALGEPCNDVVGDVEVH